MPLNTQVDLDLPVARAMLPVQTAVRCDQSVREALEDLRSRRIDHRIVYVYVLDAGGRLAGVLPIRTLLLAQGEERVDRLMQRRVVSVPRSASMGNALALFASQRLLALPVVDEGGRLLGAIDVGAYAEETIELAERQRLWDLFQMMGVSVASAPLDGVRSGFRMRIPWLAVNLAGGVACAVIAASREELLVEAVAVATFIPLVLTLAEAIAMQAMTLSLQHLHATGVPWGAVRRRIGVEARTAVALGLACGACVAVAASLIDPQAALAAPLLASVAAVMALAALLGAGLPVLLHATHLDPRIAAGPVVLMVTDVTAMAVYLAVCGTWLG
ncbi:MAG: CBS domain-containing protein [Planctomycetota bacterium]|jgi:magnesium transporter|nr:CBS domain-containing protein [Planctomycetota bacterium]MDP6763522.1 CBS domain-containing protein [Planctomycetota bacterium]MDP6990791.1 CBS domain-containing protein [Planctomycetota bacterium]